MSNLPPGCTDLDIERSQGADYPSGTVDYHRMAYRCDYCGDYFGSSVDYYTPSHACLEVPTKVQTIYCRKCGKETEEYPQDHWDHCKYAEYE